MAHQLGISSSDAVGTADLLRAAKLIGLKAKLVSTSADRLALTPLPALALMRDAGQVSTPALPQRVREEIAGLPPRKICRVGAMRRQPGALAGCG